MEKVNNKPTSETEFFNIQKDLEQVKERLKKSQKRPLFYFLLGLILIRPSLDFFSQFEFQLHSTLPYLNFNALLGGIVFVIGSIFLISNLKKTLKTPLFWPISAFLLIALTSIFYSYNPFISAQEFIRIASIFLLYFMAYRLTIDKKDWLLIVGFILASYLVPALFAFAQQIFGLGMPDQFGGFQRIFGTFAHPNLFAFYSFFILGLAISFFLSLAGPKSEPIANWNKNLILAFVLTSGGLLFFTYTRSAYAAFLIFILIIGLVRYRKLLLISALVFLLAYFLSEVFQERFWQLLSLDPYGSIVWRFRLWQDILPIALWQPWFGYGLGVFNDLTEYFRGYTFGSLDAHNDYLKILTENGLIGLAAYLWIILTAFYYLLKICFNSKISKTIGIGILAIMVSLFAASSFDNILRTTALQWNFWILIASWLNLNKP